MQKPEDPTPKMLVALLIVGLITLVATGVSDPYRIMNGTKELYKSAQGFLFPKNWAN